MGMMAYSLLWVMPDLYHQPYLPIILHHRVIGKGLLGRLYQSCNQEP